MSSRPPSPIPERHLRYLVEQFMGHYLTEPHHQGIGSQIITPKALPSNDNATLDAIGRRSRLGGVLNFLARRCQLDVLCAASVSTQ